MKENYNRRPITFWIIRPDGKRIKNIRRIKNRQEFNLAIFIFYSGQGDPDPTIYRAYASMNSSQPVSRAKSMVDR